MHHSHQGVRLSLRPITVAVLLALVPASAMALGLGQLVMHSGLDEPLNGQIELISPTAQELKTLKASLASREDFDIAGAERLPFLFDIKYSVGQSPNGKHFIRLTTDAPVREPFLHLLVQVDWNGGKLIREYSALLDPPHWVAGAPAEINPPEAPAVSEPRAVTAPEAAVPAPEAPAPAAPTTTATEELPPIGTEPPAEKSEAARAEQTQLAVSPQAVVPAPAAPAPAVPEAPVAPATTESPTAPTEAAASVPAGQVGAEAAAPAAPAAEVPTTESAAAPQAPTVAPSDYGPVKPGETLSQIAGRLNVDRNLTSQQVMIAVMRANPSAFFGNNINNLRTGKILKVPEQADMAAVPKEQAATEFRAQYDAWQEYKLKLASTSRMVTVAEPEKPAAEPEKIETRKSAKVAKAEKPAAQKSAATKAQAVDLLKIVRANLEQDIAEDTIRTPGVETQKGVSHDQGKLNERVATLEEAIDSKQLQNKEMRERVGKLQEQVKNTERLINLENKDLAQAQKQTAEKQAAEAAAKAAADKAAADKAAADKAAADKAAADKAAADKAAADKAAADKAAADKAAAAKPADAKKPVAAAPKKPAATPAPVRQEGFLDSILANVMDNSLTMALLGVVGVLAAGMGGLYAYRRRRASREFSESILSGNSLNTDASITDTSGQAAPSDTSFLSDFSQGGMGNIHTDEVDPIAEAEVYLAYGRDEQAEEILKDAIVKDPARQELKGKLLEIYFQRNDVSGFETLAEELYAQLEGKGGKVWDKVEEMGRKLSPGNPMFRGGAPSGGTRTTAVAAAGTTLLVSEAASSPPADLQLQTQEMQVDTVQTEASPSPAGGGMDFNIDFGSGAPAASHAASQDISFDLDAAVAPAPATGGMDIDFDMGEPSGSGQSSGSIDFSLPGDTMSVAEAPAQTADQVDFGTEGLGDLALDLDNAPASTQAAADTSLPGWDETATKLDLAKAYIDMGDSEGARSILDEVIAEGNDQQKQQARELVSQIAA